MHHFKAKIPKIFPTLFVVFGYSFESPPMKFLATALAGTDEFLWP